MRPCRAFVAPFVIALLSAGTVAQESSPDAKPIEKTAAAKPADPMANFARLVGGEWKVTAASGTSMFDTWNWGPGRHSVRGMTDGSDAAGNPLRELQVYYWHPGRKQVSMLGLSPFKDGVSEGTLKFEGDAAEAVVDLYQAGHHRKMGLRWNFDGPDKYHEVLLESIDGKGLNPLAEWDYIRSNTPHAKRPNATDTLKLSEPLQVFHRLMGRTWNTKGQWGGGDAYHIETTFEWVPLANAIYARMHALRGNGSPMHVMDAYVFHHTGTGRLRCLALSKWGDWPEAISGVYEGDVTMKEGGAFELELKGYEGERVDSISMRFDFEKGGSLHQQGWTLEGDRRTPKLDVRHAGSGMSKCIFTVFQDSSNNHWFGSRFQGVYRYDGKTFTQFTMKDGLFGDQIGGIQEDNAGNLYITASREEFTPPDPRPKYPTRIIRFDGKTFSTLPEPKSDSFSDWKLDPDDLWFGGGGGEVVRWDGKAMHRMKMPTTKIGDEFIARYSRSKYPNIRHSPYDIYTMFKDSRGNLWFGTGNIGVMRYDGKSHAWMAEPEFTWLEDGAMLGVRSIIEDKDGKFWFTNTLNRYDIQSGRTGGQTDGVIKYKKEIGIENKSGDDDYFMSAVKDKNGDLWMATYGAGVWRYDGKTSTHYPVMDGNVPTTVFSIYADRQGGLWLGTHEAGVYKFNGTSFEKFDPDVPRKRG